MVSQPQQIESIRDSAGERLMQRGTTANGRATSLRGVAKKSLLAFCRVQRRLNADRGLLLTFDDGPHPEVTPAVLDLLAEYDAKAVFFVVGNRIPRAPHVLQRILAEGHVIGNHTFFHPLDHIPGFAEYYRDIKECQTLLESLTGRRPQLFRPPLGSITFASLVAPRLAGLRTLLWSIDVDDWTLRRDSDAAAAGNRLAELAGSGDIVLLHDDNPSVVSLLKTALPKLKARALSLHEAIGQLRGTDCRHA
jgi:peptidoglycan/xylan/chitin deacetylase (PgdA/CDA1 family)